MILNIKKILISIILFFTCCIQLQAESIQLNTNYPTPYASYETIRLLHIPDLGSPSDRDLGTLYVKDGEDSLYFCQQNETTLAPEWKELGSGQNGIWQKTAHGIYDDIHLVDLNDPELKAVGIGIGAYDEITNYPESKLTLKNDGGILAKGEFNAGVPLTTASVLSVEPSSTTKISKS